MGKQKVTDEDIVRVLANPVYKTREEQANALNITREDLWYRLKQNAEIERHVKELVDEETANTVAKGFKRLDRIIGINRDDGNAIKALRLLLQYRGELVEKREIKGALDINQLEVPNDPERERELIEEHLKGLRGESE